jgi:hypothetical protein
MSVIGLNCLMIPTLMLALPQPITKNAAVVQPN